MYNSAHYENMEFSLMFNVQVKNGSNKYKLLHNSGFIKKKKPTYFFSSFENEFIAINHFAVT